MKTKTIIVIVLVLLVVVALVAWKRNRDRKNSEAIASQNLAESTSEIVEQSTPMNASEVQMNNEIIG